MFLTDLPGAGWRLWYKYMNKKHRELARCLALISQLGITLLTPVVLCVCLGVWLDKRFSTYFTLPLLILGILAGARSSYLLAKQAIRQEEDEEEREDD